MTVALLGECMIEFSPDKDGRYVAGYGGDTLNTTLYLARCGVAVDYITALGDDPFSAQMVADWAREGIGTERVLRVGGQVPGLYVIRRTSAGERSFLYWRDNAPVRKLFDLPGADAVLDNFQKYAWLYLSGITLSLFARDRLADLLALLDRARAQGCRIAFDGNYRRQGWPDRAAAQVAFNETLARVDLALPTLEDETALFGDVDADACIARLQRLGVAEIVIKRGGDACMIATDGAIVHVPALTGIVPVDTTAAGDAFNAGYLAGRIAGLPPQQAASQGHRLAGAVIQHRGAIIPRAAMPDMQIGTTL
jgi:2-dehydro-3-deoxygluconokinase